MTPEQKRSHDSWKWTQDYIKLSQQNYRKSQELSAFNAQIAARWQQPTGTPPRGGGGPQRTGGSTWGPSQKAKPRAQESRLRNLNQVVSKWFAGFIVAMITYQSLIDSTDWHWLLSALCAVAAAKIVVTFYRQLLVLLVALAVIYLGVSLIP